MGITLAAKAVLYCSVFLSCVSFAIVMPTIWPYLHSLNADKAFLAWVVSFYSVGEGVGAIFFGSLTSRYTTRDTMIWSTVLGVIGSALYALAAEFPMHHLGAWMVFIGRFAQGIWTGAAQAVQQAHLAKSLPVEELTANTVTLNAYACFGFVIGPSFGLIFSSMPTSCVLNGRLCANQLTSPGYFVLLAGVVIILSFVFFFNTEDVIPSEISHTSFPLDSYTSLDDHMGNGKPASEQTSLLNKQVPAEPASDTNLNIAIFLCNLVFFNLFFGFALQETITTPLVEAYYSWSLFTANLLYTGAGLCSLLTFCLVATLSNRVSDSTFTSVALALGAVGYTLLLGRLSAPPDAPRFLVAFCLVSVMFPLGRAGILSLYTKTLPPALQGTGQGAILAVGAVARIVGPFCAVSVFASDAGGIAVFGLTAAFFAATLAGFGFAQRAFGYAGGASKTTKGAELCPDLGNGIVPYTLDSQLVNAV